MTVPERAPAVSYPRPSVRAAILGFGGSAAAVDVLEEFPVILRGAEAIGPLLRPRVFEGPMLDPNPIECRDRSRAVLAARAVEIDSLPGVTEDPEDAIHGRVFGALVGVHWKPVVRDPETLAGASFVRVVAGEINNGADSQVVKVLEPPGRHVATPEDVLGDPAEVLDATELLRAGDRDRACAEGGEHACTRSPREGNANTWAERSGE